MEQMKKKVGPVRITPKTSKQREPREAHSNSPAAATLPKEYPVVLADLKRRISEERIRTVLAANAAMVMLYWDIGTIILERQQHEGWGTKVVDRLSRDLCNAFPDMQGLSPRNLKYMRAFAAAWPDKTIVQRVVAQIPWRSNIALLDKLNSPRERLWYAQKTVENGWSQPVLALQIESCLYDRQGKTINNFSVTLPPEQSDMAEQIFKDPYLFDFLGTADLRRERELEESLVAHIQRFLLELGAGFAFVGRQVHLEVGNQDFYLDLLFYHLRLRCYIVVELKAGDFDPAFVGQMNVYLSAVDDLLRHPDDKPAVGLLLCKSKNRIVVDYALRSLTKPIGVAEWETQLVRSLPKELKPSLPSIEELEKELTGCSGNTKSKRVSKRK
ncbi:MAG TPA: PDDEXK nuclease domain-containing protein [Anaerohalosphaeraceae bacterium]|nr:PDDEXK nuclease domain-containing protein [Anaerohalosphaeraceae bacterium]